MINHSPQDAVGHQEHSEPQGADEQQAAKKHVSAMHQLVRNHRMIRAALRNPHVPHVSGQTDAPTDAQRERGMSMGGPFGLALERRPRITALYRGQLTGNDPARVDFGESLLHQELVVAVEVAVLNLQAEARREYLDAARHAMAAEYDDTVIQSVLGAAQEDGATEEEPTHSTPSEVPQPSEARHPVG